MNTHGHLCVWLLFSWKGAEQNCFWQKLFKLGEGTLQSRIYRHLFYFSLVVRKAASTASHAFVIFDPIKPVLPVLLTLQKPDDRIRSWIRQHSQKRADSPAILCGGSHGSRSCRAEPWATESASGKAAARDRAKAERAGRGRRPLSQILVRVCLLRYTSKSNDGLWSLSHVIWRNNHKPPFWEWFIHGDLRDGLLLFYPHYIHLQRLYFGECLEQCPFDPNVWSFLGWW